MKTLEKLPLVKEMITQLVVYQIVLISKKNYKMIAIDLSEQQTLYADRKAIQQIDFTANLESISFLKKQKKLSQTFHEELQKFCKYNSITQRC